MTTMPLIAGNMTDEQRAVFYAQMSVVQKDEVVGVLLALFLGAFGAHHFYLRRNGLGILYAVFCWTGITAIIGLIEAFFMPGRVRQFNAEQASLLAANLRYTMPGTAAFAGNTSGSSASTCAACGASLVAGVRYCNRCGAAASPSV